MDMDDSFNGYYLQANTVVACYFVLISATTIELHGCTTQANEGRLQYHMEEPRSKNRRLSHTFFHSVLTGRGQHNSVDIEISNILRPVFFDPEWNHTYSDALNGLPECIGWIIVRGYNESIVFCV